MKYIISLVLRYIPRPMLQRVSRFFVWFLALFYRGKKVQCPICQHRYHKFLPYGRKGRPNALCPNCLALERHRLLWLFLQQKTDFFSRPKKVLHIAPEVCFTDRFEAMENIDYITADLESPWAKVKMDIHQIPFEEDTFDVVMCNHVLEHVENDIKAMQEIHRVLRPGGWAFLQIPFFIPVPEETQEDPNVTSSKERERKYGQNDHVRLYGKDYKQRLEKGGFKVTEDDFVTTIPFEDQKRFALDRGEMVYFCEK
ncbi:MAG: class I SAM-dependent methyltransferase [Cyclobacteriaceae bacterium]